MDKGPSVNKTELRRVCLSFTLNNYSGKVFLLSSMFLHVAKFIYIIMCKFNVCLLLLTFNIGMFVIDYKGIYI